jgi:hypothetical protein
LVNPRVRPASVCRQVRLAAVFFIASSNLGGRHSS